MNNRIRAFIKGHSPSTYLFILSAPLCGSTLLHEVICSGTNVSANNTWGTREGQKLPTVQNAMYLNTNKWNSTEEFDWVWIREEWLNYWDTSKPILLEKSPPNIVRAGSIERAFEPSYFIVMVRNPYAQCEGLMRRNGETASNAAQLVLERMKMQKNNLRQLKNVFLLTYEQLCDQPEESLDKLKSFLPALNDLSINETFKSHNIENEHLPLTNLNKKKMARLSNTALREINQVFKPGVKFLDFFGYQLIE